MRIPIVLLACVAFSATAESQDLPNRYAIERIDEGIIRLDSLTGTVSLCAPVEKVWSCRTIKDDTEALRHENEMLKARVMELEAAAKRANLPRDGAVDRMMMGLGKLVNRLLDDMRS